MHEPEVTVSTRSIFGNFKYRPPFPALRHGPLPSAGLDPGLWGADAITSCSVCDSRFTQWGIRQVWLSAWVGTDVLPLLVNACSDTCVNALPPGAERHIQVPHPGGPDIVPPNPRLSTARAARSAPGQRR